MPRLPHLTKQTRDHDDDEDEDEAINSRLNKSVKNKYECESDREIRATKKKNNNKITGSAFRSADILFPPPPKWL